MTADSDFYISHDIVTKHEIKESIGIQPWRMDY